MPHLDKLHSGLFDRALRQGDVRLVSQVQEPEEGFTVLSSLDVLRINAQFFDRQSAAFIDPLEVDLNQLCMGMTRPTEAAPPYLMQSNIRDKPCLA